MERRSKDLLPMGILQAVLVVERTQENLMIILPGRLVDGKAVGGNSKKPMCASHHLPKAISLHAVGVEKTPMPLIRLSVA